LTIHSHNDAFMVFAEMARAFRHAKGFEQSSILASVEQSAPHGSTKHERLTRSFHWHQEGCFTVIHSHGRPRSPWLRKTADRLTKAGYERRWVLADETGFRRWLSGERQRAAELRFLCALGETGAPDRWPRRAPSSQPIRPPLNLRRDRRRVTGALRASGLPWNVCAAGFSRRASLSRSRLVVEVTAIAVSRSGGGTTTDICVRLLEPPDDGRDVPLMVIRGLRHELRRSDYRMRRSGKGGLFATKRVRSANSAARECVRIFELLMRRTRETGGEERRSE
jgi:hypothetical protein